MEAVFQAGLEALLKKHEPQQKLATKRTAPVAKANARPSKNPGYVSRDMNRQVFTRDGFRCVYVAPDGRRCTATTQLQVDHVQPKALGGSSSDLKQLRTLCATHNAWMARQVFGNAFIDRKIRLKDSTVELPLKR